MHFIITRSRVLRSISMKHFKRITCLALILVLLLGLSVTAFAEESTTVSDPRFDGKTWDEVISDFLSEYNAPAANVGIGYVNLVTGEEHYLNGDEYRVAASMYKVPMNMIFGKMITAGEMTLDTVISGRVYRDLQRSTIVFSSNDMAEVLWNKLGGYQRYRQKLAPIMGEDPYTVDQMFYKNNYFTPRQMMYCLTELYNNPDGYPGVLDCMLEAEPSKYFRASENRYTIAHKYGLVDEDGHSYLNDCAIVWTDEPFTCVIFTDNCPKPYSILSGFISLMIDYTQYQMEYRLAAEAAEQARLEEEERLRKEEEARLEAEAAVKRAEEEAARAAAELESTFSKLDTSLSTGNAAEAALGGGFLQLVLYFAIAVAALIAVVEVLQHAARIRVLWGILSALAAAAALVVCVYGSTHGTVLLKTAGDPDDTVTAFFDAITSGDFDTACAQLSDTAAFGLGTAQSDSAAGLQAALLAGYSYELYGEPIQTGLTARRAVLFTYLDLNALAAETEAAVDVLLPQVVETLSRDETYDTDGNYLPSVTDEVYSRALASVLEHADRFYKTTGLVITLNSIDGQWYMTTDSALLSALSGGLM